MSAAQWSFESRGRHGARAPRGRVVLHPSREQCPRTPAEVLERATGHRLGVHYQPIIARAPDRDGHRRWRCVAGEALVRAGRDLAVRPDQLLPAIRGAGLEAALFEFVLGEALAALRAWRRTDARVGIAVNLHAEALVDERLPEALAHQLEAGGAAAAHLTLEICESAPISDLKRAARTLARVRAHGVRVALDDFGAGFSTLTRLDWLECDELKIDATLVRGIEYSEERRCVVESLVTLAHAHGMTALAEGVETEAALDALTELGCDRAQGFLIAQPVAAAAFGDCARRWEARACRAVASGERQLLLPGLGYDSGEVLEAIA